MEWYSVDLDGARPIGRRLRQIRQAPATEGPGKATTHAHGQDGGHNRHSALRQGTPALKVTNKQ